MRDICACKAQSQLLAAQAEALDPLVRHCAEIRRVRMRLFAPHQVRWRIRQIPVELPQIGENETLDLTRALRLVEPVDRRILRAIEDRAEDG